MADEALWRYYLNVVRPEEERRAAQAAEEQKLSYTERTLRALEADPPRGLMSPAVRVPAVAGAALADAGRGLIDSTVRGFTTPGAALRGDLPRPDQMPPEDAVARALDVAGIGFTGGAASVGRPDPNALGIFAGKKAATADMEAFRRARKMEAFDAHPADIWRETGWGRGADGEWRFEINDRNMRVAPDDKGQMRIEHPDFEAAYPGFLASTNQDFHLLPDPNAQYGGLWDRNVRALKGKAGNVRDLHDLAAHELQHAAQSIEGFSGGTNPGASDVAWQRRQIPRQEIDAALRDADAYLKDTRTAAARIYDDHAPGRGLPPWDRLSQRQQDVFIDKAMEPGGIMADRAKDYKYHNDVISNGWGSPYSNGGLYLRNAGEVEARNVAARRLMTDEERRQISPWATAEFPVESQWSGHRYPEMSWSQGAESGAAGAASASVDPRYYVGDQLAPAGSGYQSVPGKPATVDIPGHGRVEARPIAPLMDAADSYMRSAGRPGQHEIGAFPPFDEDRARRIARAFEVMRHDPADPAVRRSYDAMIDETLAQYQKLKDTGVDFHFLRDGETDPYWRSPSQGYADLVKNGRLTVFPTDYGFGTNAAFDPSTNPLLKGVGRIGDKPDAVANDAFRVVHDAYGHFAPGNPFFRHQGEERAWLAHSRMYSPEALPAMTSETRGQNSWLNFGPHGDANRKALGADTVFADQKTGLMDPWTYEDAAKKFADGGAVPAPRRAVVAPPIEDAMAVARRPAPLMEAEPEPLPPPRPMPLEPEPMLPVAPVRKRRAVSAAPEAVSRAVDVADSPLPRGPGALKPITEEPIPDAELAPLKVPPAPVMEHALGTERGERKTTKTAKLTEGEKSLLADLPQDRKAAAQQAILRYRSANPVSDGTMPIEARKVEFDEKGNPAVQWNPIPYAYHYPEGVERAPKPGSPEYEAQAGKVTDSAYKAIRDVVSRANAGDEAAKKIIRQVGWYRETMAKGFNERGGAYPAFSDALGATSPNTSVDQNYRYSVEGQREFARGTHDDKVRAARDYQGSMNEFPVEQLLRRPGVVDKKTGEEKQYGMNSRNLAMAFADRWRDLEPGQKPKARNFSGNLGGATDEATIDVWAARFLRRMAGKKRIPVAAEQNVQGDLGKDLKATREFGFGQDVFRRVAKKLNQTGELTPFLKELGYDRVTPMDLQALTWFIEKEHWTRKNWTTQSGEGGSFEDEIKKYPSERWLAGHSITQDAAPSDDAMAGERKRVEDTLRDDPKVRVYRVHPTFGAYGGSNERSFDTELTAAPDWSPRNWMSAIVEQARDHKQSDVFFSRRLPDHEVADHPNARPGIEVYFKDRKTIEDIQPVLDRFVGNELDGFTYITDLRIRERDAGGKSVPDYVGVRLQWVPEIIQRFDPELSAKWAADPTLAADAKDQALSKMGRVLDEIDRQGHSIVDARIHHYDTMVLGKEDYDDFLGQSGGFAPGAGADGGRGWLGQPLGSHLARRDRALRASEGRWPDVEPRGALEQPEPVNIDDYLAGAVKSARRSGGRVTALKIDVLRMPSVRSGLGRDPVAAALAVSTR